MLFGVLALMWRDADTWQSLHRILSLPFGTLAGEVLMAALIVGGIGVMLPRAARAASLLLAMLYALFALVCIPGVVAAPRVYAEYDGFFEQFSLLCGAVALYAASGGGAALGRAA